VGRLESLLAPILTEDAGCLKAPLEAAVQLFERLTLSGVYEHMDSQSGMEHCLTTSLLALMTTPTGPHVKV